MGIGGIIFHRHIELVAILIGNHSSQRKPEKGRDQRNVAQTSREIIPGIGSHIDDQRDEHVKREGAEEMGIHCPPGALAAQPEDDETGGDNQVLTFRNEIVVVVVLRQGRRCVGPRKDEKNINEQPPGHQQRKIQVSQAGVKFAHVSGRAAEPAPPSWECRVGKRRCHPDTSPGAAYEGEPRSTSIGIVRTSKACSSGKSASRIDCGASGESRHSTAGQNWQTAERRTAPRFQM